MNPFRPLIALLACMLFGIPLTASAQPPPQPLPQDQLDALLAPIALYPDELLTQVLMASTYPLEVVEAARFVKANPTLGGPALDDALKDKTWDPSVLSLVPFPQVLDMMNEKLEWTQRLGDAFLADEAAVMRTVQMLRQRAEQVGNLQSNAQQRVFAQDQYIVIEPAQPQYVYVPVYNPRSSTGRGGLRRIARGTGIRRRYGAIRRRRRRGVSPRVFLGQPVDGAPKLLGVGTSELEEQQRHISTSTTTTGRAGRNTATVTRTAPGTGPMFPSIERALHIATRRPTTSIVRQSDRCPDARKLPR